jgi:sugar phosphate isomerase/epimerase
MDLIGMSIRGLGIASVILAGSATVLHGVPIPEECKVGDFFVGCQAFTFREFTVFEQIEKTAQAGGKLIELHPKDKVSPDQPDLKWDHNASDETIQRVKDQLAKYHLRAVNYGVVYSQGSEAGWRKVFAFARKMGFYGITTEATQDLDILERLAKEYDLKVGVHNHPKRPDDTNYKNWDANYVFSMVKDRDPHIGICADTGHWMASGLKPLDCIKLFHGRIMSVHLNDRKEMGRVTPDVVFGTGLGDIQGVLAELKHQGFAGNISMEYVAKDRANTMKEVAQCIEFIRRYGDKNQ